MFVTHLFYKPGSRPGQIYPQCEKTNADQDHSNGQTGCDLVSHLLREVTCAYCHFTQLQEIYDQNPQLPAPQPLPVHWSVHPVFSRDGSTQLLHWAAACGEVNIYPDLCLATRQPEEVTCTNCKPQVSPVP